MQGRDKLSVTCLSVQLIFIHHLQALIDWIFWYFLSMKKWYFQKKCHYDISFMYILMTNGSLLDFFNYDFICNFPLTFHLFPVLTILKLRLFWNLSPLTLETGNIAAKSWVRSLVPGEKQTSLSKDLSLSKANGWNGSYECAFGAYTSLHQP